MRRTADRADWPGYRRSQVGDHFVSEPFEQRHTFQDGGIDEVRIACTGQGNGSVPVARTLAICHSLPYNEAFGVGNSKGETLALANQWVGQQRGWHKSGGSRIVGCKVCAWEALNQDLATGVACAAGQPAVFRVAM